MCGHYPDSLCGIGYSWVHLTTISSLDRHGVPTEVYCELNLARQPRNRVLHHSDQRQTLEVTTTNIQGFEIALTITASLDATSVVTSRSAARYLRVLPYSAPFRRLANVSTRVYTSWMKAGRAKLFQNGGSQAVRLPADCRFPRGQREVIVRRVGHRVVLEPLDEWPDEFLKCLGTLSGELPRPKQAPIAKLRDPFE